MIYIGLSGFSYKPWQGEDRFYPPGLKAAEFLPFYAERFNAVEMDSTWYRMPSEAAVEKWLKETPEHFLFTFKAHRSITHIKRLKEETLESVKFMADRLKPMQQAGKLGCIFFQLAPSFKRNDERLSMFLRGLPQGPRYAVEFRNSTWHDPAVEAILLEHNVAWVAWDTDEEDGQRRDTGPFIYDRLRKEQYTDDQLNSWAKWVRASQANGKDALIFFKHEDEGSPWVDANRLKSVLSLGN